MQFEPPKPSLSIIIRSFLFNIIFYINLTAFLVIGSFFLITPRIWSIRALQAWGRSTMWWMRIIVGTKVEFRGVENIPQGACLLIGKHQSLWDTFAILTLTDDPAMVLKKELTYIPLFGWFCIKFQHVIVDRAKAASALRNLLKSAKEKIDQGRQIMIFPEGTRKSIGEELDYKPGASAIYLNVKTVTIPFGLNSGLYWPRRKFMRYPGTIVVEFGKPIPPGLKRRNFAARSQDEIEAITDRLVADGIKNDFGG